MPGRPPPPVRRQVATRKMSSRRLAPVASTTSASERAMCWTRSVGTRARSTSPYSGWARRISKRRPLIALASNPFRSSLSASAGSPNAASSAEPTGSPNDDQLDQVPLRGIERPQPGLDQLDQTARRRQRGHQTPDPALISQRAISQRTEHHLPQEQRIALGTSYEQRRCGPIYRPTEHGGEQLVDGLDVEIAHLDPLDQSVPPQRHHRVRGRLTSEHSGQHERRLGVGQLVDQGGGRVIEEMGVFDQHDQSAIARPRHQRLRRPAQQIDALVCTRARRLLDRREQRCHRAKWQRGGRSTRRHADRRHARTLRPPRGTPGPDGSCRSPPARPARHPDIPRRGPSPAIDEARRDAR